MTTILYRYLMILVACVAMLIGLQVPNFVDQYQKRVDAHLREVTVNLQPFLDVATKYFGGDINKLIALHRNSAEKPFQDEGAAIEQMVQRKLRFEADLAALNTNLFMRTLHVVLHADSEILDEAIPQYSYAVPLDQDALIFGTVFALFLLLSVELFFAFVRYVSPKLLLKFRQLFPKKSL